MPSRIERIRTLAVPVLKRCRVKRAGLFGSVVRAGSTRPKDIDVLVEVDQNVGLLDFIGIKLELERALGAKVDLVEYRGLKRQLKIVILKDEVRLI